MDMVLLQTEGSGSVRGCCLTSIRMLSVISLDLLFQWDCSTAGGVKAMTLISSLRGGGAPAWDYQVWLSRCLRAKRDFFSSPVSELADGKHKSLPT